MASELASTEQTPITRHTVKRKKPNDDSPDILHKPVDTCGHCGRICSGEGQLNEAIQCDLCASWVHASCEDVSSDDYKLLTNLTATTDNLIYYCNLNQCLSRVKQIVFQHLSKPPNRSEEFSNRTEDFSQPVLLSEHQTLCDSVSALSDKINHLCAKNDQLQTQINCTISSLSDQAQMASPNAIDEYMDRERRKSNLIVYGLPEASAPTGPERRSADINRIQELVHSEFNLTSLETTKCFRLGKRSSNPRPLLISIVDNSIRRQILRNAKILRNSNSYKNVFISPDLTPQERVVNKQLRAELQRRKESGEPNLIIRRGKIIPKQSPSKATSQSMDTQVKDTQSKDIVTTSNVIFPGYRMFRRQC